MLSSAGTAENNKFATSWTFIWTNCKLKKVDLLKMEHWLGYKVCTQRWQIWLVQRCWENCLIFHLPGSQGSTIKTLTNSPPQITVFLVSGWLTSTCFCLLCFSHLYLLQCRVKEGLSPSNSLRWRQNLEWQLCVLLNCTWKYFNINTLFTLQQVLKSQSLLNQQYESQLQSQAMEIQELREKVIGLETSLDLLHCGHEGILWLNVIHVEQPLFHK